MNISGGGDNKVTTYMREMSVWIKNKYEKEGGGFIFYLTASERESGSLLSQFVSDKKHVIPSSHICRGKGVSRNYQVFPFFPFI